jgi:hypothetical protein
MILADVGVDIFFGKILYIFMLGFLSFFTCVSIGLIRNVPSSGKIVAFLFVLLPTLFGFYIFHRILFSFCLDPVKDAFWSGETFYIGVFFSIIITFVYLAVVWIIGKIIIGVIGTFS